MSDTPIVKVRNLRPWAVEIAATGQVVEGDGTVEVVASLAKQLCEQPDNWAAVKTTNNKKEG